MSRRSGIMSHRPAEKLLVLSEIVAKALLHHFIDLFCALQRSKWVFLLALYILRVGANQGHPPPYPTLI